MTDHLLRWFLVFFLGLAIGFGVMAMRKAYSYYTDTFIQLMERRQGVVPGQTRVVPECNCTIKYIGTTRHGKYYDVRFEKLD